MDIKRDVRHLSDEDADARVRTASLQGTARRKLQLALTPDSRETAREPKLGWSKARKALRAWISCEVRRVRHASSEGYLCSARRLMELRVCS